MENKPFIILVQHHALKYNNTTSTYINNNSVTLTGSKKSQTQTSMFKLNSDSSTQDQKAISRTYSTCIRPAQRVIRLIPQNAYYIAEVVCSARSRPVGVVWGW